MNLNGRPIGAVQHKPVLLRQNNRSLRSLSELSANRTAGQMIFRPAVITEVFFEGSIRLVLFGNSERVPSN